METMLAVVKGREILRLFTMSQRALAEDMAFQVDGDVVPVNVVGCEVISLAVHEYHAA